MLKGVMKLPVIINNKSSINIYKKLAEVNKKIGRLDTTLKNLLLTNQF